MKRFLGIGLVVVSWLIFFSPIISGQYAYFLDDLKAIYYPMETVYAQFQHNWQLPVWSNAFGFGQPLLAWGQLGFFTPLHVIMRALYIPPIVLLQASVVLYFLIGAIGMYFFLIRRSFHQYAAALGAIVFIFCGFSIGHLNHVNFYTGTMLLPLLLITTDLLIQKPTARRSALLAITAASIALSSQPQVTSYVFAIGFVIGLAMFIQKISHNRTGTVKTILLTIVAGAIGFMLSSYSIFPLQEFVPNTERAAGLPYLEQFEFSYPPYETITLIFPYFFGDHASYHGPKGFQELAAYTGVIPILLAGIALCNWKKYKPERIAGIILVVLGAALALGRYSALYHFLVDNHYFTTIGVVGRFVFFFDIGIVLLSVIGLQDLIEREQISNKKAILSIIIGYLVLILLVVVPFWVYASYTPDAQERIGELLFWHTASFWIILIGLLTIPLALLKKTYWVIPLIASITLISYSWSYNPRVAASIAYATSPFVQDLQAFKNNTGIPARVYAAQHLPVTGNPHVKITLSDYISPKFTVFQPLQITRDKLSCITIPVQSDNPNNSTLDIMIRSGFSGTIWYRKTIASSDAFKDTNQRICFPEITSSTKENLMLSVSSSENTNMKIFVTPSENPSANLYFLRVQNPTDKQLKESIKPLSVEYTPEYPVTTDMDNALLIRHDQALAGASSATWIGALSVRSYREFVDGFFANDSDAFDGDGIHALTRNRSLVNMAGVTHFTQSLDYGQTNDPMLDAGYSLVDTSDTGDGLIRLYLNPNAYGKAFMVPRAEFIAADDDTRANMRDASFNPKDLVYLSGPTPPNLADAAPTTPMQATATITHYSDTRVDVRVVTNKTAYLVLTDATLPEWQTLIDGTPALQLKADSVFKAAQVPAGDHVVSFTYSSPAVNKAVIASVIGLLLSLGLFFFPTRKN